MKILTARHLGMCFGVEDAIHLALNHPNPHQLTILGDLVHNETVLEQLRTRGLQLQPDPARINTPEVMITAHGASNRAVAELRSRGLRVFEATCPLVRHAHRALAHLVEQGYYPVVIGKAGHVEVRGLTGDFDEFSVILDEAECQAIPARARFGVVAQTTQPIDKVRRLVEAIRKHFPQAEVKFVDTVCLPTKQRQAAAWELAKMSTVVVVIGGNQSNNTRELVSTSRLYCQRVYHVQNASELVPDWFVPEDTVGVTAGTSTPPEAIEGVIEWLEALALRAPVNGIARCEV